MREGGKPTQLHLDLSGDERPQVRRRTWLRVAILVLIFLLFG